MDMSFITSILPYVLKIAVYLYERKIIKEDLLKKVLEYIKVKNAEENFSVKDKQIFEDIHKRLKEGNAK